MKTKIIRDLGIVGKSVEFTTEELRQMAQMCNKVVSVIDNHHKKGEKKIYLDDEDLCKLEAIFMCVLETECDFAETVFDKYIRTMKENRKREDGVDNDIDKHADGIRIPEQFPEDENLL